MINRRFFCSFMISFLLLAILAGCSGGPASKTYQSIGSFSVSEQLAPVKQAGKWGFINTSGDVAVPANYESVKPFSEGYAAVRSSGLWGFVDTNGTEVIALTFFDVGVFSEGLAPAKRSSHSDWGYINTSGTFVIEPQFEKARHFSEGLAAVFKDERWSYINTDGTIVLTTDFYAAFSFTEEGLALVQPTQNGKFEFIDRNGNLIPPISLTNADIAGHHDGLAAVYNGEAWGYIDTQGSYKIPATYGFATRFNEDYAVVRANGKFNFIDRNGNKPLWGSSTNSFDFATPFSGGLAVVGNENETWYVDKSGQRLNIASGTLTGASDSGSGSSCSENEGLSIQNSYMGGFIQFQIQNHTNERWNVSLDTPEGAVPYSIIPGAPVLIDNSQNTTTQGLYKFFVKYGYGSSAPLFNMTLTTTLNGNNFQTILSNSTQYTATSSDMTWWDYLKDAIKIIVNLAKVTISGGEEWWAAVEAIEGMTDMINGSVDGGGNNNGTVSTTTNSYTGLSATVGGVPFNPLSNVQCGSDQYLITDGSTYVMQLTAARTSKAPPQITLDIFYYANFFAIQAANQLNNWRNYSNGQFIGPPWNGLYPSIFENYADLTDNNLCYQSATNTGYMQTASGFTVTPTNDQAMSWWNYANNFAAEAQENPSSVAEWSSIFNCQTGTMTLPEGTAYEGMSVQNLPCSINIPVTAPKGRVVIGGNTLDVSSNTCTAAMASCEVNVLAFHNSGKSVSAYVSDGVTRIEISALCQQQPE